jgi:pantoate--beta-alanine ligase
MKTPRVFTSVEEWREFRRTLSACATIGFVPTMGALHEGHASLLRRARAENDFVALSIYVNSTQFNDPKDLEKYPRTLDSDVALAGAADVDFVIAPTYPQMYPDSYQYRVSEARFSAELCGAHRPGHFDGVLTVVMKFLNFVRPSKAYFGEKDYQQLELIRGMASAFFLETEIVGCPTVRESDGLAMSSRNLNLDPASRAQAGAFPAALRSEISAESARKRLASEGIEVDYIEDRDHRRYGAVRIGGVRLIDNVDI